MQELLKQYAFTENKFHSECRNYLNKMCLPRIKSVGMQKFLKQNVFTENKFQRECRNYLNKMCLPRIKSVANAEITTTKGVYREKVPERMHKSFEQNVFIENKVCSGCRNYLNKMCLPRISSRANAKIT
jgi:glutaredoxin 2